MYRLKKEGLIEKRGYGENSIFSISKKGLKKIKEEENKLLPEINYTKPKGDKIILVSFDIPEEKRNKRDWLRRALAYLGFENIHQSVFITKGKMPKKFFMDLKKIKLINYIEIIEVTGSGTLNFSKKDKK
jgi:DNA-binding transcriptional regulator PaaX